MLALSLTEIQQHLANLSNWTYNEKKNCLQRRVKFSNYYQTMAFVNAVAFIAHQKDHHPDLEVSYQHCVISYSTHDANGITMKDIDSAMEVDKLDA